MTKKWDLLTNEILDHVLSKLVDIGGGLHACLLVRNQWFKAVQALYLQYQYLSAGPKKRWFDQNIVLVRILSRSLCQEYHISHTFNS